MQPIQTFSNVDGQHAPAPVATGQLRHVQVASLVGLGVLFWLIAVLFIRYSLPAGVFGRPTAPVLFVLTVPAAWVLVWILKRAAALRTDQLVAGVAVASAAALLCDGAALTWTPFLYAADSASLLPVAVWLLWGVGVCLALALVAARRELG